MPAWIVEQGGVSPYDPERLPRRDTYGLDWIYVEAPDEAGALAEAVQRDAGIALTEVRMFEVAYRAGVVLLPGDERVTINRLAERAGVARATVQAWRRRHRPGGGTARFPEPLDDEPTWAWSDIAGWLRLPRLPGRPRKG